MTTVRGWVRRLCQCCRLEWVFLTPYDHSGICLECKRGTCVRGLAVVVEKCSRRDGNEGAGE